MIIVWETLSHCNSPVASFVKSAPLLASFTGQSVLADVESAVMGMLSVKMGVTSAVMGLVTVKMGVTTSVMGVLSVKVDMVSVKVGVASVTMGVVSVKVGVTSVTMEVVSTDVVSKASSSVSLRKELTAKQYFITHKW